MTHLIILKTLTCIGHTLGLCCKGILQGSRLRIENVVHNRLDLLTGGLEGVSRWLNFSLEVLKSWTKWYHQLRASAWHGGKERGSLCIVCTKKPGYAGSRLGRYIDNFFERLKRRSRWRRMRQNRALVYPDRGGLQIMLMICTNKLCWGWWMWVSAKEKRDVESAKGKGAWELLLKGLTPKYVGLLEGRALACRSQTQTISCMREQTTPMFLCPLLLVQGSIPGQQSGRWG